MRVEFSDIVYSIVQSIDREMIMTGYSVSGTTHSIEVCDLKWVQVGRTITIDGNDYLVTAIDEVDLIITATGSDPIEVNTFQLYAPQFFYGTPIDTKNQLQKIQLTEDKYPMIYLLLNYREINTPSGISVHERTVSCRLFALSDSNFQEWTTADIHQRCIKPMGRLMDAFIQAVINNPRSFYTEEGADFSYDSIPQYKFGVNITNKGTDKSFFVDDLSGWEFPIDRLIIRKNHTCNECYPVSFPQQFDDSFDNSFA